MGKQKKIFVHPDEITSIVFLMFSGVCRNSTDGAAEWVILELQGDLESRCGEQLNGNFIGDLHYTDQVSSLQATA